MASEFAAPTQMMIAASRSPSYSPASSASLVTGPSSRTPAAQSGSGTSGRSSSTCPTSWPPKMMRNTTRSTTVRTASIT